MSVTEETRAKMETVMKVVNETPFYRAIGMRCVGYDDGEATFEMEFSKDVANVYGTAHGGAIASIADSVCGIALSTKLPPGVTAVTMDLRVNYLAPFKSGKLVAKGEVVSVNKTSAIESARLMQDDRLIAIAQAVHFIKRPKD